MAVFRKRWPNARAVSFPFSLSQSVTVQVHAVVQNAAGLTAEANVTIGPPVIGFASGWGNAAAQGNAIKSAVGHAIGTSTATARRGGKPVGILLTITKV